MCFVVCLAFTKGKPLLILDFPLFGLMLSWMVWISFIQVQCQCLLKCFVFSVDDDDEVTIKEAAEMVVEGMKFKGEIIVCYTIAHLLLFFCYICFCILSKTHLPSFCEWSHANHFYHCSLIQVNQTGSSRRRLAMQSWGNICQTSSLLPSNKVCHFLHINYILFRLVSVLYSICIVYFVQ